MSQIDWSKAPEGTTAHHAQGAGYTDHWMKDGYFCVVGFEADGWVADHLPSRHTALITKRPLTWTGEGLPPVGADVEWIGARGGYWVKARIIAEDDGSVVIQNHKGEKYRPGAFEVKAYALTKFRPIRTPGQTAAKEREKKARAMYESLYFASSEGQWDRFPESIR